MVESAKEDWIISTQQKAYSSERNIRSRSMLMNLRSLMDYVNKKKMATLIILVDFRKAFESIDTTFIDTALDIFGYGPSFRRSFSVTVRHFSYCMDFLVMQ